MKRMHPTFTFSTIPFAEKKEDGQTNALKKNNNDAHFRFPFQRIYKNAEKCVSYKGEPWDAIWEKKLANRESPDPKAIAIILAREREKSCEQSRGNFFGKTCEVAAVAVLCGRKRV